MQDDSAILRTLLTGRSVATPTNIKGTIKDVDKQCGVVYVTVDWSNWHDIEDCKPTYWNTEGK